MGGPGGDNGLSGKKLVAQAYGSAVPIGGGATCGKDPHKVDPRGQALARELALEAVCKGSAREATVWLAYRPGDVTPRWTEVIDLPDDGYTEDAKIQYWQSLYDGYRARMIADSSERRRCAGTLTSRVRVARARWEPSREERGRLR